MNTKIKCDKCGHEMAVEQALRRDVEERLRRELQSASAAQQKELVEETRRAVEEQAALELADLRERLAEQTRAAEEARKVELALRKKERELAERAQQLELEALRRLETEREELARRVREQVAEEYTLKDREKDKRLTDLKEEIAALKRKSEVTNNEHAGTSQEVVLDDLLRAQFPEDCVERVAKGRRGADLEQGVFHRGHAVARIVIESKNTKAFNQSWLAKLREDMVARDGSACVLVTQALPDGIRSFGLLDGVWVTDLASAVGLVAVLRAGLIEVSEARSIAVDRGSKAEALYDFVTGDEFRNRLHQIVGDFKALRDQVHSERLAFEKQWKEREKLIESVLRNTSSLVGSFRGVAGRSVPEIEGLSLSA